MLTAVPFKFKAEYGELLKNRKNYLIRLYPDKRCDISDDRIVTVAEAERCADVVPVAGGGSRYSFKEKTNYFGNFPYDIYFIDNKFITGYEIADGAISEIGNVEFEKVNLDSEALKFLTEIKPGKNLNEVKKLSVRKRTAA
jgi:uncharacterized protein YdgA (DUF945 family)